MSLADLSKQLDAPEPERWKPEEGDRLLGTIRAITYRSGMNGYFAVVTIEDESGAYWDVSCGPASLKRPLSDKRAQPGDLIGIVFHGIAQTKDGRDYKNFRLQTEAVGDRIEGAYFDLARAEADADNDLGFVDGWSSTPPQDDPVDSMPLWAREQDASTDEPAF